MNQEQLAKIGALELIKEQQYAIQTEIEALTIMLHQKVPVIDGVLHKISEIDTKAAQVLLNRIQELHKTYQEIEGRKQAISQ